MQERKVTAAGTTHTLDAPFMVFATQNPIEQEGTYRLPEAQLDRFMFSVDVGYPSEAEEVEIVNRTVTGEFAPIAPVLDRDLLLELQRVVRLLPAAQDVVAHCVRLARATRPDAQASDFVRQNVRFGAGPRASQYLLLAAKVRAALRGHDAAHFDDVHAVAGAVLRHRIGLSFAAEAAGIDRDAVLEHVLSTVARP